MSVIDEQPDLQNAAAQCRDRLLAITLLVLACAWAIYVHLAVRILPYDDAHIIFRYVANTMAGKGPVYNPGQRIFGVSTPLYFAWLVALKAIFYQVDIPTIAVRTNALWFCLSGIGVFLLLQRCTSYAWATTGAVVVLLKHDMLVISTGGMESFMFTTLAVFALFAASCRRSILYGVLTGLAILTRLEGIWLLPVGLLAFSISWRRIAMALAPIALLVLLWIIPATLYFGTPVPHSIIAKAKPIYVLPPFSTFEKMIQYFPFAVLYQFGPHKFAFAVFSFMVLGTLLCGKIKKLRRNAAYGPSLLFFGIFVMYTIGNPLFFPWYKPLISLLLTLAILLGGYAIISNISTRSAWNLEGRVVFRWIVVFCLLVFSADNLYPYFNFKTFKFSNPIAEVAQDPQRLRCIAYQQCANYLNSVTKSSDCVAAPEIGVFGYYYKGKVLDTCGLVSPEAIPFLPTPVFGDISARLLKAENPNWIVTLPVFGVHGKEESKWFREHYHLVHQVKLPQKCWGNDELLVFHNNSVPIIP